MTDEGTGESEEDEEAIVLVEDYAALEEEGVTGLAKGKYTERPKEVCMHGSLARSDSCDYCIAGDFEW